MRILTLIFFACIGLASCAPKESNNDLIKGEWIYLHDVLVFEDTTYNLYETFEPYSQCDIWTFLETDILLTGRTSMSGYVDNCNVKTITSMPYRMPNPTLIYLEDIFGEVPYDISFSSDTMKFTVKQFYEGSIDHVATKIFIK